VLLQQHSYVTRSSPIPNGSFSISKIGKIKRPYSPFFENLNKVSSEIQTGEEEKASVMAKFAWDILMMPPTELPGKNVQLFVTDMRHTLFHSTVNLWTGIDWRQRPSEVYFPVKRADP
jgi:hypothetical protein